LTATISYIFNGSDLGGEASINHLNLNISAFDADMLYAQCVSLKLETSWWYYKANRITLRAGTEPSEAYLLLRRGDFPNSPYIGDYKGQFINQDWRNAKVGIIRLYQGKDDLTSAESAGATPGQWDIKGWMFHSAIAVNASNLLTDDEIIYLVKFVDTRFHWARSVNTTIEGQPNSYNVVDRNGSTSPTDYTDITTFPYVSTTVTGSSGPPLTFATILNNYWSLFSGTAFPAGGSYPAQYPLDIRPENRTHYATFMELLHSSANELYPTLAGGFTIAPIDANFQVNFVDPLRNYAQWLIDEGQPQPEYVRIPNGAGLRFKKVYLNSAEKRISNYFITNFDTTSIAWGGKPIFIDEEFTQEVFTTSAMVSVDGVGDALGDFTTAVLTRYYKSRNQYQFMRVYNRFIPLPPSGDFEEVEFACVGRIITTAFRSKEASIGASFIPENFEGIGSGSDHLVIANADDEVPESFFDTVVDHSAYDSGLHQIVYAQVIEASAGPPVNKRVKLFTAVATGAPGPTGTAGADGDTVISGYCIVVAHAGTVAQPNLDLTLATAWNATPFQFFAHLPSVAGLPTDPKWITVSNYVAGDDQIIWHRSGSSFKAQTTGNYSTAPSTFQFLLNASGNWSWVDAWKIACTSGDTVASYLHDAWFDPGAFNIDQDPLIKFQTQGAAGSNQTERAFLKSDAIFGWDAARKQSLGHDFAGRINWGSELRLIYGFVKTDSPIGLGTVDVDHVHALANGDTPVSSDSDVITALKWFGRLDGIIIPTPEYKVGDKLILISTLSETDSWWVLPFKQGKDGVSGSYTATIVGSISSGSASAPIPGTGNIFGLSPVDGTTTSIGIRTLLNPFQAVVSGSCTCGLISPGVEEDGSDAIYLILGILTPISVDCTSLEVPTDVVCDEDGISVTTETITYVVAVNGVHCGD
jgi:hypothetical protein